LAPDIALSAFGLLERNVMSKAAAQEFELPLKFGRNVGDDACQVKP
jgi:hypothetical protein